MTGTHDEEIVLSEAQKKEEVWMRMQQSLACRVNIPETECALLRPSTSPCLHPSPSSRLVLPPSSSFVHADFALPWSDLQAMLSSSGLITQRARPPDAEAVLAPQVEGIPEISFQGWQATSAHGVDARCWATQLLHDVAAQSVQAASAPPPPLQFIGGIDISFVPNTNIGVACLAVLRYPSLELCHRYMHHCVLTEPYVSGFLAFREVQPVTALFNKVRPELEAAHHMPQLLFVDGCGVHHPRRCGLASHLSVVLDIPTIGCAKKMLVVGHLSREWVETNMRTLASPTPVNNKKKHAPHVSGDTVPVVPPLLPLITEPPEWLRTSSAHAWSLYGYALQTSPSVKKCIYVSPGSRVGYAMAAALVLLVSQHRVAEPIRAADLGSRAYIREVFPQHTPDTDP